MANRRYPRDTPGVKALCCDPEAAASWLNAVAELALDGDPDASRCLPNVIDHFLAAVRADA